jgi:hypothetical protein
MSICTDWQEISARLRWSTGAYILHELATFLKESEDIGHLFPSIDSSRHFGVGRQIPHLFYRTLKVPLAVGLNHPTCTLQAHRVYHIVIILQNPIPHLYMTHPTAHTTKIKTKTEHLQIHRSVLPLLPVLVSPFWIQNSHHMDMPLLETRARQPALICHAPTLYPE